MPLNEALIWIIEFSWWKLNLPDVVSRFVQVGIPTKIYKRVCVTERLHKVHFFQKNLILHGLENMLN